ncbi:hypothetical protein B0H17DRAFT_1342404 [Mycena rosella]|uniref:Uncharacterized protein n=1 Tax=Mycena rosella TaxID=1033263 RepID=A0AAD7AXC8_MYCRO|nr:hypothetical protein B0H17DRAFT_1342404 [Mycena rosella]
MARAVSKPIPFKEAPVMKTAACQGHKGVRRSPFFLLISSAKPVATPPPQPARFYRSNAPVRKTTHASRLPAVQTSRASYSKLSTQYAQIEHMHQVAFPNLTCQTLWEIGRTHLNRRAGEAEAAALCAGVREPSHPDGGFPRGGISDGLLTEAEREEIALRAPGPDVEDRFDRFSSLADLMNTELYGRQSPDSDSPSVLNNLSRKQYVREAPLRALQAKYAGKQRPLGREAVEGLTGGTPMGQGDSPRGLAKLGERPIRTCRVGMAGRGGTAWPDVMDEVMAEFDEIWRAEYSSNQNA